jgi:catechol 2,3-dioxygenase-like lactoylglutathione lyase family enzyme
MPTVEVVQAGPDNPFAARAAIYTIVAPDIEASVRFYRDVIGYQLLSRGVLADPIPRMAGVGQAGRPYALLRHAEHTISNRGIIRLLQAPAGAVANRARPGSRIIDPGLAVIECHPPHHWETAYHRLIEGGATTVAAPVFYYDRIGFMAFSAFGPAGEQMFIACPLQRPDAPNHDGLYGPFVQSSIMSMDRWAVISFYDDAFGLKSKDDDFVLQESINTMIGAPPGTYFSFGGIGGHGPGRGLALEWYEYRQWEPPVTPPWPTQLDRTGLAMTTIVIDRLAPFRDRLRERGIPIIGEGALPTPDDWHGGVYIRGSQGELIEVVAREKEA